MADQAGRILPHIRFLTVHTDTEYAGVIHGRSQRQAG
jgi:hypothetical protein